MDNLTKVQRSYNMSRIQSKNSNPEIRVRKELYSLGLRYRLHVKDLPGTPDIVFRSKKIAIFINGCFWHMHSCGRFKEPKSNPQYWLLKIQRNVARDAANVEKLNNLGWKYIELWECEIKLYKNNLKDYLSERLKETGINIIY